MENFNPHSEQVIGFKKLSKADLGFGNSHQTHIGLYNDVLHFLPDVGTMINSILIYQDNYLELPCFFDRIQNPDGSFRSPKIRTGNSLSIAKKIREYASKNNKADWYLLWLANGEGKLIFVLLCSESIEFEELYPYLYGQKYIFNFDPAFGQIVNYINKHMDKKHE